MTYQDKIEQARQLVAQHNEAVGDDGAKVDFDGFLRELKKSGGTSEDRLSACSFEDLEACGLPKLLAKDVGRVFRSASETGKKPFVTANRAAAMSVGELLAVYDPREADNPVGKTLSEKSKGQPCIVFNDDGTINVAESTTLLQEIREGLPPRTTVVVSGIPQPVYKIGERPDQYADENPLYPGRVLRLNGDCDQTNRSWNGVSQTVRVLLHLAVSRTGECRVTSLDEAHNVLDRVMVEGSEQTIRQRYPEASKLYDELSARNEVPSLKVALGGRNGRSNNPFAVGSGHRTS